MTPAESIDRLSPRVAALAEAVSLAIRIEPQLLRKMRLDLFPAADAGVEADLWFSPLVESRTPSGIVLQQTAAQVLRQRLGDRPAMLEAAWCVTAWLHQNISPAILTEERLAYLALAGKFNEMRELLRSLVATLVSPRGRGLAGWLVRAIGRLPDAARDLEEAQMLAFGASLRLGEGWPMESSALPARMTEWAAWLSPDDLETVPFGVALLDGAVEFGPPGRPQSHRVEFPKTVPVLVELGWLDGSRKRTERVQLHQQNITIVETGLGIKELDLRTVLGGSYILAKSARPKLTRIRHPRVHITTDVETGNAIEMEELPFVLGVLGDFSGQPVEALSDIRDRKFVEINPDNFDGVLAAMKPHLALTVADKLHPEKADEGRLKLVLEFKSLDDFEPQRIAEQIPGLRQLLDCRTKLSDLKESFQGNPKFEERLDEIVRNTKKLAQLTAEIEATKRIQTDEAQTQEAQTTTEAPAGPSLLDQILKEGRFMTSRERVTNVISEFAEEVLKGTAKHKENVESTVSARISQIDALLSRQLDELLHDPKFQKLEATWRGLRYLLDQSETGEMLKIRVLNISKRELLMDYQKASEFDQSALFQKLYEEGYGVYGGAPYGVLIGDYEFNIRQPEDIELIERLAATAAASHCPFLSAASPDSLGLEEFTDLELIRDISKAFATAESAKWNSFRENNEDSRFVGLCLPRMLMRLPYGRNTRPVEEFEYEEEVDGTNQVNYPWCNVAYALATTLIRAFAQYEFCTAIHGPEDGGKVEGLPVHDLRTRRGDIAMKCPVEVQIPDSREKELSDQGFIPLVHCKDTGYAAFFSVQSCQKPKRSNNDAAQADARFSAQLPYIFAACRFAQYMKVMMRDKIGRYMSKEDLERFLSTWIAEYVLDMDAASREQMAKRPLRAARIQVEEDPSRRGVYRTTMLLQPQLQLGELNVSLRLVAELPRR